MSHLTNKTFLQQLWLSIRIQYFPDREDIDSYHVCWSKRGQTRCLASCNTRRKRIEVAASLNSYGCLSILEPLLYHEMCHAILGEPKLIKGRRSLHGREFKLLEKRHPQIPLLNEWIKTGGWTKAVHSYERVERLLSIA